MVPQWMRIKQDCYQVKLIAANGPLSVRSAVRSAPLLSGG